MVVSRHAEAAGITGFSTVLNISTSKKFDGMAMFKTNQIQISSSSIFSYAHGTLQLGDSFYIGTREAPGRFVNFSDPHDLSLFSRATTTGFGYLESLTYDDIHDRIYAIARTASTSYSRIAILSINPHDVSDWHVVFSPGSNYGSSPTIVTDGEYVYGALYTIPSYFFKIRISDWTMVKTQLWTGSSSGHASTLVKYGNRTELYFTSSGYTTTPAKFAKVNPVDLSYVEIPDMVKTLTDDIYCRKFSEDGAYCYVSTELTTDPKLMMINTQTMTKTDYSSPPSYGIFSNGVNLYNLMLTGGVIKYPNFDLTSPKIYDLPGEVPNEFFSSSDGKLFFTNWAANSYLKEYAETAEVASTNNLTINWSSVPATPSYDVYLSTDGVSYTFNQLATTSSASFSGLTPDTQYWFRITATGTDPGLYSERTAVFTPAALPAVSNITSSSESDSQVLISWNGNSPEYYIKSDINNTNSGYVGGNQYSVSGLSCGNIYYYQIKARNFDGVEGDYSNFYVRTCFPPTSSAAISNPVVLPAAIGEGATEKTIGMNQSGNLGIVTEQGINYLSYINSKADFGVKVSATNSISNHNLAINDLDLYYNSIRLTIQSLPQTFDLKIGDVVKIDLDNDGTKDMEIKFTNIWVSRAELTIKSISHDSSNLADTPSQVQEINAVKDIQTAPAVLSNSAASSKTEYIFKRNLSSGMSGSDVKELQQYLNSHGFIIAKKGPGSPGKETIIYGPATKAALTKFQVSHKISPASGYFGPITRGIIN